ncbi:hypothetical protein A2467_00895 [Candidatus Nomurabacteria bacterium RIFOXYC2_FULL_36_8]|nr:MAG: Intein-containing protein [Candidatus Nomurabacteria bacterium GW2011_GWE2_36_115]KKP94320.1 MAG: Intein-containing protein [Candidatus Nomurabacteria bacterium GW2011_GWF2_36_126]KKP96853.1 MAG: Intein-containing protein [Candidatus Nomurabacteria bacterium GW2011_GWD2_36_14]KKP99543.1 MAG: Intein-containing protein [Candidatus Nomurabacteria bacterium GW2011_GWF2_36_19]KKQ05538.1 MAG: Intein-containing protein [Candidatus Nomurabacteria bacterium GW2011_GWF1_36_47]KKQ09778.1 MAG: Int
MAYRKGNVKIKWNGDFAYVIGVIATDGNLSPDLRHIHITSKDEEMLLNCKKCLGINNLIGKKARGGSKDKKYYVLQFGDKNFFEFLLSIGITPKKSKTINELKIPKEYFKDFLRGCIDGDGSITISKHKESKHPQYKVRLCSASKLFLEWILKSCIELFEVKGGSICLPKESSVYTLTFAKEDSIKVLQFIYKGKNTSLSRKRNIAFKILKQSKKLGAGEKTAGTLLDLD